MIQASEIEWLRKALDGGIEQEKAEAACDKRLEGFSLLVRHMVKRISGHLDEMRCLAKECPASDELVEMIEMALNSLRYLERFCREKIAGDLTEYTP